MSEEEIEYISESTLEAERYEGSAPHRADRPATPEEEEAAAEQNRLSEGVAEHFENAAKRGGSQCGEGRVE